MPTPSTFSGPAVTVTQDSSGTHVKSDGVFELDFAASGAMLPDHFRDATGAEMLGANTTCGGESMIGIAMSPGVSISGGSVGVTSSLEVQASGPGVAKIHVTYSYDYNCPGATTLTGTSDFTIVPSGRIVRQDKIQPTTSALAPTASCGCATTQDNFTVSTYYTFASGGTQVKRDGTPIADGWARSCSFYSGHSIAVSFPGTQYDGNNPSRFGDGLNSWDPVNGTTSLDPNLDEDNPNVVSAIQIGDGVSSCDDLQSPLDDTYMTITTTGTDGMPDAMPIGDTGSDGLFEDTTGAHTAPFSISLDTSNNHPTRQAGGWAIAVDLGGAEHATVTRDPDLGRVVGIPQRKQGNVYYIYFPDGLAQGESITVTPQ